MLEEITSLEFAEKSGKRHRDVLNTIRGLLARNLATDKQFVASTYRDKRGMIQPMFVIAGDGLGLISNTSPGVCPLCETHFTHGMNTKMFGRVCSKACFITLSVEKSNSRDAWLSSLAKTEKVRIPCVAQLGNESWAEAAVRVDKSLEPLRKMVGDDDDFAWVVYRSGKEN